MSLVPRNNQIAPARQKPEVLGPKEAKDFASLRRMVNMCQLRHVMTLNPSTTEARKYLSRAEMFPITEQELWMALESAKETYPERQRQSLGLMLTIVTRHRNESAAIQLDHAPLSIEVVTPNPAKTFPENTGQFAGGPPPNHAQRIAQMLANAPGSKRRAQEVEQVWYNGVRALYPKEFSGYGLVYSELSRNQKAAIKDLLAALKEKEEKKNKQRQNDGQ